MIFFHIVICGFDTTKMRELLIQLHIIAPGFDKNNILVKYLDKIDGYPPVFTKSSFSDTEPLEYPRSDILPDCFACNLPESGHGCLDFCQDGIWCDTHS